MVSLMDLISDIRVFLYGGTRSLPLVIAGTLMILGLMTANYAALFFLVGFIIIAPLAAKTVDLLGGFIGLDKWFKVTQTDICQIIIPYITNSANSVKSETSTLFSSLWVSMMSFFFGYMISNGVALYSRPAMNTKISIDDNGVPGVAARTSQALISIITTILMFIALMGYRLYTGCETKWGMLISIIIFGLMGHSWYLALSGVGQDRLSDLFGIANRLLPETAIQNSPIACIPIRAK